MEQFIRDNGYMTVFLSIAFGGEFGLFVGVALAHTGSVTLSGVIALGTAASFVGNMIYFYGGNFLWAKVRFLKKSFGARVQATSKLVERFGPPLMLVSRFLYGIRNVVPIALGIYEVNTVVFIAYNVAGAFIWAWIFTEAGNVFAASFIRKFASLESGLIWWIGTSAVVVLLFLLIRNIVSKVQNRNR